MKFAIKKIEKVSGETFYVPICKEKGLFNDWKRIDKIYGRYYIDIFHIDDDVVRMTWVEAESFVKGYISQYKQDNLDKIKQQLVGELSSDEYFLEKF